YHLDDDFAELNDLAAAEPDRLRKMIELWWSEAGKYAVLPLDDRDWERGAERLRMNPNTRYGAVALAVLSSTSKSESSVTSTCIQNPKSTRWPSLFRNSLARGLSS